MSPTMLPARHKPVGIQGRHVLLAMLAFFGVVLGVNALMLWQAIATHSGVVALEPYRKGLAYNARIAAGERQAALGWSVDVTLGKDGLVALALADASGKAVEGLVATGTLGRPTANHSDLRLRFAERQAGAYTADAGALEPGAWQLDVVVHAAGAQGGAGEIVYRMRRWLWLTP